MPPAPRNSKGRMVRRYQVRWKYGELMYSYGTADKEEAINLMNEYAGQDDIQWVDFHQFTISEAAAKRLEAIQKAPNVTKSIWK